MIDFLAKNKRSKIVIILIIAFIVFLLLQSFKSNDSESKIDEAKVVDIDQIEIQNNGEGEIVYFYGSSCKDCDKINSFLNNEKLNKKSNLLKKEVLLNKGNKDELIQTMRVCDIYSGEIIVPLVYDSGKCFVGSDDIIEFLVSKE